MRVLIGFWLLLSPLLWADELQTGVVYRGPLKLTAHTLGASFMIPSGWKGELVDSAGPMVLEDTHSRSRILMEANVSVVGNPVVLLAQKLTYYDLSLFSPTQIKKMRPSLYYRQYRVTGSDTFKQALLYLVVGTQGRAVVLYGFFEEGMYDTMRQTMMMLAERLSFTPIRALPKHMKDMFMRMEGGHFVFYERIGSFSERREVWLCRSQEALFKGTYSGDNHTARFVRSYRGTWHLEDEDLVIEVSDNLQFRYPLSLQDNNLLIDGVQSFRLPNHMCD